MRTFASIAVAYLLAAAVLWGALGLFARASQRGGALDSDTGNDLPFAFALLFGLFYLSCGADWNQLARACDRLWPVRGFAW